MTPGTAATRRKTVSFGVVQEPEGRHPLAGKGGAEELANKVYTANERGSDALYEEKPRQSTLTQTLVELSKRPPAEKTNSVASNNEKSKKKPANLVDFLTDSVVGSSADHTVDLSQPRSRSGQHWKTEYDQYHRRSNREMKKIIKYGQNVKSYAVKKDSEATNLNEKLKRELARVASMESKVSKLATQLNNAQFQGPEEDSDQTRLVSELAQQTALAIRYKQRADAYRARLQKLGPKDAFEDIEDEKEVEGSPDVEVLEQPHEIEVIRAELDSLRTTAKAAEKQAERLEKENATLKRSLARVKEEMMSYETRRQAREERLKKREAKHKAARDDCEKRLAQLTVEYEELVRTVEQVPIVDMAAEIRAIQAEASLPEITEPIEPQENNIVTTEQMVNPQPPNELPQQSTTSISPRRKRLPKPPIDIWTISSPHEGLNNPTQSQEPPSLPPSSVKHDIHRTLKEIDQNLVPNQYPSEITKHETSPSKPPLPPTLASPAPNAPIDLSKRENVRHIQTRRFTDNSPRPSMISLASSPAKLEPAVQKQHPYPKASGPTVGRSASLMSGVGGRPSTMGSGRGSALPAERAAAAKARLAKRSAEKRMRREVRS